VAVTESSAAVAQVAGQATDLLVVRDVAVTFGGVTALRDVSLEVAEGAILGMVGPNGAGKTTLMNVISGIVRPVAGHISYSSERLVLTRLPRHDRARLGIGRTFQHSRLFPGLTVIDQLLCGAFWRTGYGVTASVLRLPRALAAERLLLDEAREVLAELGLSHAEYADLSSLPSPHRRLVDLGRALMSRPRLLLLDEIAAGMTDVEKARVIDIVRRRNRDDRTTVLVIEHDLAFVRAIAQEVVVMAQGTVLARGETDAVLSRQDVLKAYVGE
jgi:branched-chain amino acid transport system ATP-binding protein